LPVQSEELAADKIKAVIKLKDIHLSVPLLYEYSRTRERILTTREAHDGDA